MKHTALAAAFAMAATGAAAGSYTPAPVEAEPAPAAIAPAAIDWTGFYAGLQYGEGDADLSFGGATLSGDFDAFGFHAGYTRDFGQYVAGGELSFNDIDADGDVDGDLVQLRARAGLDLGRFMPYATLGLARVSLEEGGADISESGLTYGVGAEFMVTEQISLGVDYSRSDFSDVEGIDGLDLDTDLVQLRASFRF